jgi:hypothetical protein
VRFLGPALGADELKMYWIKAVSMRAELLGNDSETISAREAGGKSNEREREPESGSSQN